MGLSVDMDWPKIGVWEILLSIDEFHSYIQFVLPITIFITLEVVFKRRFPRWLLGVLSLIFVLIVILENQLHVSGTTPDFLILGTLALLPWLLYELITHFWPPVIAGIRALAMLGLLGFCLSQSLLGGCIIHSGQNWLAWNYLRIEEYVPIRVFGSQLLPGSLLRVMYGLFSLVIFSVWILPNSLSWFSFKKSQELDSFNS